MCSGDKAFLQGADNGGTTKNAANKSKNLIAEIVSQTAGKSTSTAEKRKTPDF